MDWRHGYYAESGYTYGHFPETMPVRLRWAALVQGQLAPARGFRYLDAGCGQGYNLVLAALLHPESEFVGIDFMPEHVAHGRALAARMGLGNVHFIEGDFLELSRDPGALGAFEYAVCHGISSWVAPDVRAALFALIGKVLAPGGLFYNSYNTHPGWLPSVPFQHLVLLEQRSKPGPEALTAAREHIDAVIQASPVFGRMFPGLDGRLKELDGRDPTYLVQEYNNQHWQPQFVSQMIDAMAAVKLDYLGSATLAEAFGAHVPVPLRKRVAGAGDVALREQLIDYAISQGFRRDLYVKGRHRPWRTDRSAQTRAFRFVLNPIATRPGPGEDFKIKAGSMELKGPAELYNYYLDRIAATPDGCSLGELVDADTDQRRRAAIVETLSMMVHGGWLLPLLDGAPVPDRAALLGLTEAVVAGAPYAFYPLPIAGAGVQLGDSDWIALAELLRGAPEAQLAEAVAKVLARTNRQPMHEGEAVKDPAMLQRVVTGLMNDFVERRLPFLRRCQAL